ncbi:MAG TPA: Ig-like domain-containing protein [Microbacterium sp.]|nr:Ig-like domain-containing protein [Microbacterium sp.]
MIATATRTAVLAVLAAVLIISAGVAGPKFSSAAFTAQTVNAPSTVGAAKDWTPPTVSVQDQGVLRSTVSLTAVASDAETGIRQVVLAFQPAGATTWTTLCTAAVAPYSCSWDTRTVPDGPYDVRAIATDNAGYSTTSALLRVTVGNTITVLLSSPGDVVTGAVSLTTTLQNAGPGAYAVRVEYAATGGANWKTACTAPTVAPYTCSWPTPSSGDYDLRSVATLNGVTTYSAVLPEVLVDNTAPSVSLVDPGSPLRGTVTLTATASDEHSGLSRVAIQYSLNGTTWTDACAMTVSPYSCRFSTTSLSTGTYAFRAVATDTVGLTSTSASISRLVDNSVASVAMEDPGAYLSGTATLTASANSTAGVSSVAIQFAPRGTTSWTTVCTTVTSPYACTWDTKAVADGSYDFRAILTDPTGKQTISASVTARNIDNRAVRGVDVQTANGGATAGRLDAGDTIAFTYSTQMSPGSISAGWNGTAIPVNVRLRDGAPLGTGSTGDTLDIVQPGTTTPLNLGSVLLRGDYIRNNKTSFFNGTMTANTITVNGLPVTVVQITVGANISGGALRTVTTAGASAMVWTPSAAARDLSGNPSSVSPVTESGALDREF